MTPPPQIKLDDFFKNTYIDEPDEPKTEQQPTPEPPKKPERKLTREEKREEKLFVDTMMYAIAAPIVFGERTWADTFPDDMREWARIQRMVQASKCMDSQMCTNLDVVAFMYPMTMVTPMRHEYVKIYMYVYKHALPDKWKILLEDDPDLERMTELYDTEKEDLNRIKRTIFKRQMESIKSHG